LVEGLMETIVGRETELATIARFIDAIPSGPVALVLEGEVGIGKTTLWKAAIRAASERSCHILSASPAESEINLPYATLTDLLDGLAESVVAGLPDPQRRSLEVALRRRRAEGPRTEQHAISLAVLTVLRRLAQSSPTVLALDDMQWIDSPSARVLQFAIRRLEKGPIGILIAEREPDQQQPPLNLDRALPSDRIERLTIGALPGEALIDLLRLWLPAVFSRSTVGQLAEMSAGNPFFALEIGRFLLRRSAVAAGERLPIPENLKELIRTRLVALPDATDRVLLAVASLAQPTERTLQQVVGRDVLAAGLERALEARILARSGERIRFTHPLIGTVVYADAAVERRRQLHRQLADLVDDPEEHARHLALATESPDEEVALALDNAAAAANARGAPDAAASLSEQARKLMPADRPDDLRRRTREAADYHVAAGDLVSARILLQALVKDSPAGDERANAFHRLGQIEFYEGHLGEAERFCDDALAAVAGNVQLEADIRRDLEVISHQQGKFEAAETQARILMQLAEVSGNPRQTEAASLAVAMAAFFLGQGMPQQVRDLAVALAEGAVGSMDARTAGVLPQMLDLAIMLKWADDFHHARQLLRRLLDQASEQYDESFRAPVLFHLGELECWAGDWQAADAYALACQKATHYSGRAGLRMLPLSLVAMLAAHRGQVVQARSAADEALSLSLDRGDALFQQRSLRTLGFLELSLGNPDRAESHLSRLGDLVSGHDGADPGILRFEGDQIETLIALGRLDDAHRWMESLEQRGRALDRAWALAISARCRALLSAAHGDLQAAEAAAIYAIQEHQRFQQPFELGRTLLVMGAVRRRSKQKAGAAECLRRSVGIFDRLGARLWAENARTELARVSGRSRGGELLTPTEMKVASVVAKGRTNREASRDLFMSIKTVEANLSKIYRKLDVRSRSELAARMARDESSSPRGTKS
jgi:DNA-binding CsgD family transcriptional regulator